MNPTVSLLALAVVLSGCSDGAGGSSAEAPTSVTAFSGDKAVASPGNPYCHVDDFTARRFRAGDNLNLYMKVVNSDRWCFSGISLQTESDATTLYTNASHGDVRLETKSNYALFGYRPKPGFSGSDRFTLLMQTGVLGIESHVVISVDVKPGEPDATSAPSSS